LSLSGKKLAKSQRLFFTNGRLFILVGAQVGAGGGAEGRGGLLILTGFVGDSMSFLVHWIVNSRRERMN